MIQGGSQPPLAQDEWVLANSEGPGFFVEAGAGDGVHLSNTIRLEEAGWTGLCVEPSPDYAQLCRNRTCRTDPRCLMAASGHRVRLEVNPDRLLSKVSAEGTEWRSSVSLLDLLQEHDCPRQIDYLSLDVEGEETRIFGAFPFGAYRFRLMTVEHNYVQAEELRAILTEHGYELVKTVLWEDFWRDAR